jgi:hypothetical protein
MVLRLISWSLLRDARPLSEADIGGREIVEALVLAPGVVVFDKVGDDAFEISGSLVFSNTMRLLRRP